MPPCWWWMTRTQLKVMGEERFMKRNKNSGQFMARKKDGSKFKGIREEKPN